jgi:hypothetical protein
MCGGGEPDGEGGDDKKYARIGEWSSTGKPPFVSFGSIYHRFTHPPRTSTIMPAAAKPITKASVVLSHRGLV